MKYIFTLALMILSINHLSAINKNFINKLSTEKVILLANPTVRNIEIIDFLIRKNIFNICTSDVKFIGVYLKGQSYDFSQSQDYIEKENHDWLSLFAIDQQINLDEVFQVNACTEIFRDLFNRSSGVIFFGGPDIQPEMYGEDNLYSEVTDPMRHIFEVSFAFHLVGRSRNPGFIPFLSERPDYLVTGFCLGMQTMNVAAGGTLWQDIPAQVYGKNNPEETVMTDRENIHRNYWQLLHKDEQLMSINLHWVKFTKHPFFGKMVKAGKNDRPRAYSSHHQSVKDIGMGYAVTALSPDGKIIEGFAHNRYPHVFAVQFHPEVPALYENREQLKFEPGDKPSTMHRIIGRKGVRFHKNYWKLITGIVNTY